MTRRRILEILDVVEQVAPAVSESGSARLYFDSTSKTWKISQDGAAYVDVMSAAAHALGGAAHTADTLANLNTKITGGNLDFDTAARPPTAHATDHQNAGSDEINVAGLSGLLADAQTPAAHAFAGAEHTASLLAAVNAKISDATLDDSSALRTPTAHAASHKHGGSDEVATATPGLNEIVKADGAGDLADGWIKASNVTQHQAAIDHDALLNSLVAQHRIINDGGVATTELWSASKIDSELSTLIAGIDIKAGVDTTTTGLGNITLSGEQTLNGLLTSTSRVLVTEQTLPQDNGIYVTAAGAWARAADADQDAEVTNGNITHVLNSGSTKFKHKYLLVTPDTIIVGTTGQTWEEHKDIDFGTTAGTATEGDDSRVPIQDENDALLGTNGTPSTTNRYVTNTDPRNTDARTPTAHALGGAEHTADSLANLNAKVTGGNLDFDSASRPPSGAATGGLGGTYPAPTVDGMTAGVLTNDAAHGVRGGGTQHANAVAAGAAGFMTGADKTKLDGLPASAVPTTRILTAGAGLTGGGDLSANRTFDAVANADGSITVNPNDIQVGVLATDAQHGVRGGGTQHANAVAAGAAGFMTGADKTKLDGVEALADVTDTANVNAAGAVMETDYTAKGSVLAASAASTPANLAVGTNGQRLTADSAETTGMKWETPTLPKQMFAFDANDGVFPATNPMQGDSRGASPHSLLSADDTTEETVRLEGSISEDYRSAANLLVRILAAADTATTGAYVLALQVERIDAGGNDIDTDSPAAEQVASATTTNAATGVPTLTTLSLTNAQADLLAKGEAFRLFVRRKPGDAGDNMTGDLQILRVTGVQA